MTRRTSRDIILLQLVTQVINQLRTGGDRIAATRGKANFPSIGRTIGRRHPLRGVPRGQSGAVHHRVCGLLYKKRGIGMFVAEGARENLRRQRFERFYHDYVEKLVHEAKGLGLTLEQLLDLVRRGFHDVN